MVIHDVSMLWLIVDGFLLSLGFTPGFILINRLLAKI